MHGGSEFRVVVKMRHADNISKNADAFCSYPKACVLAIGMFDGLHRGHRRVIDRCLKLARKFGATAAILTFDPHPSTVIKTPHPPAKMLYAWRERSAMFAEAGAGAVFVKNFDARFAEESPEQFAQDLAKKFPNLKAIVTGENFLFGREASGNAETLAEICKRHGWKYEAIKRIKSGGKRISSTRLREALQKGNLPLYKRLAGRPYEAFGKVVGGRKLGRKLGFPTLNVGWNPDCKPPFGAYAVEVESASGASAPAVASYGTSPTLGENAPLIEAHILGRTSLKTGSRLRIRFLKFLRPQKKFASLEDLREQISKDKALAAKYFERISRKAGISGGKRV